MPLYYVTGPNGQFIMTAPATTLRRAFQMSEDDIAGLESSTLRGKEWSTYLLPAWGDGWQLYTFRKLGLEIPSLLRRQAG